MGGGNRSNNANGENEPDENQQELEDSEVGKTIQNEKFKGGKKLSAISLAPKTHKDSKQGVHDVENASKVLNEIDKQTQENTDDKERIIAVHGSQKQMIVSFRDSHWQAIINKVYSIVAKKEQEENIKTEKSVSQNKFIIELTGDKNGNSKIADDLAEKIDKEIKPETTARQKQPIIDSIKRDVAETVKKSYDTGLNLGLVGVKTALYSNQEEGTKNEIDAVLVKLENLANNIWKDIITIE